MYACFRYKDALKFIDVESIEAVRPTGEDETRVEGGFWQGYCVLPVAKDRQHTNICNL